MSGSTGLVPHPRSLGRLLRISLAPSAAADALVGAALAGGAAGGLSALSADALLLALASLSVFSGGMALNDWADRERDARNAPGRPIPSGAVAPGLALALGLALLAAGPLLALALDRRAALVLSAVALCAVAYDLLPRGRKSGPLLLGSCRAGNLGAGLTLGAGAWPIACWPVAAAYGGYVLCVALLALDEDSTEPSLGSAPRVSLAAGGLALLCAPWVAAATCRAPEIDALALAAAAALAAWAALPLLRRALSSAAFDAAEVRQLTGAALRRLLVFTAALAIARGTAAGWLAGGLALLGYPVAYALRRAFPPT